MNHRGSAGEGVFKLEEASRICLELLLLCYTPSQTAFLSFHFQLTNDEEMPSK